MFCVLQVMMTRSAFLALGLLCLLCTTATGFKKCPRHCTCTQSSFSGSRAKCKILDPSVQDFPQDIVTLVVENYPDERLPAKIFTNLGLDGLLTLSITNGSVRHINKDAFVGLNYLEDLDLSYNLIERLDPHTFEKIQLKRLNLNGNPIAMYDSAQPEEMRYFLVSDSLVELTLANGRISSPTDVKALSKLTSLEFLDLSGNQLRELKDDMFSSLINLEEINLSNNVISHIDRDTFADIDELTSLNLRGNPLRTLEGIEVPGLKDLDVSNCNFEMLSASTLEGFPELSSLNLSQNSIMTIDMDTFMSVPGLKDLDISYNKLRGPLNSLLFEFNKRLETLSFQGNSDIKYLFGFKGVFPHLYNYDISKCGLTSISNNTFKGMNSLVSLNVSGNSIVHLEPRTFSNLPNLVVLDLSSNVLHALHNKIFAYNKELSKLYLSKNFFRHLTPGLFSSTMKLHHLDVGNCRLTSLWNISESLNMRNQHILRKLTYLNVSGNKLTKLHMHYFICLENLQKLDISNNPIDCTSDFSHVMQWLIMKKVMPNKLVSEHHVNFDLIENNVQWDDVLRSVCPSDNYNTDVVHAIPATTVDGIDNTKDIEIPIIEETNLVWPMVLVWASLFSILFAAANIIGVLIYKSRSYKRLDYKQKFNSTLGGGHFQVRRGGKQQYQKLYEECSVPTPVHVGNKMHLIALFTHAMPKNNANV